MVLVGLVTTVQMRIYLEGRGGGGGSGRLELFGPRDHRKICTILLKCLFHDKGVWA